MKRQFKVADEAEGKLTAVLQENLTGIRVVRAFARDDHEIGRFAEHNRTFRDHLYRLIKLEACYWAISDFVSLGQISIVVIAAGIFLAQGSITVGELFAFLTLVSMAIWPVRRLGHVLADSGKAVISLKRINHILEAETEPPSREPAADAPDGRADGDIVFEHVSADYRRGAESGPGEPVIDDFSVHIPAGQTVGIVGCAGGWQVDADPPAAPALSGKRRPHPDRRPRHPRRGRAVAAPSDRRGDAGPVPLLALHRRQSADRATRCRPSATGKGGAGSGDP